MKVYIILGGGGYVLTDSNRTCKCTKHTQNGGVLA